jgi:hypothetical protein
MMPLLLRAVVISMLCFNAHVFIRERGRPNWLALLLANFVVFGGGLAILQILSWLL